MIMPNLRSFSFVATPKMPPAFSQKTTLFHTRYSKNWISYVGGLVALGLHIVWFFNLPQPSRQPEKLTLPTPISVSWISPVDEKKAVTPPPKAQPEQKTRKIEKPKPQKIKTVAQNKPKLQPVKKQQLIHSTQQTTQNAIETQPELPPVLEKIETTTPENAPAQNVASSNLASSSVSQSEHISDEPIVLPNLNASYLNNPAPPYPSLSRQNGEQGKVLVRTFVNEAGNVEKVTLKKSSGYERLDNVALETVKAWRFVPATQGDKNVSAWIVVPISFSLEG